MTHLGCKNKTSLGGLYSSFIYRGAIKKLIADFKFQMVKELQETIANLLDKEIRKTSLLSFWKKHNFVFTPLPLHSYRQRWRGFNQSSLIGEQLASKLGLSYSKKILIRTRFRPPQVGLSQKQRKKNIKSQFAVSSQAKDQESQKSRIKKKNIIIIDDVWTTGSTLKEAGRVLKTAGANQVWGLTFCRSNLIVG